MIRRLRHRRPLPDRSMSGRSISGRSRPGAAVRRAWLPLVTALLLLAPACGLTSGSALSDEVRPGSVGQGLPLEGADLTVTSKAFTEQLILGSIMGIAFQAAGATVLDRTGIQGAIGSREAVVKGEADAGYEYTGTGWITYLGRTDPIPDPREQWQAVRDADLKNGVTWLEPAELNNTYALAMNRANFEKYGTRTLSDVAALSRSQPDAVTLCVESEFANRADGLPGMKQKYGMEIPAANVTQMDTGIVYTQAAKGSCTFGEVYTTDGRIKSMDLVVLEDDKKFFPNYNAAPMVNSETLKRYPQIPAILDPITGRLTNSVAQNLNARVDVDGEDPHQVALDWMLAEGFVKSG